MPGQSDFRLEEKQGNAGQVQVKKSSTSLNGASEREGTTSVSIDDRLSAIETALITMAFKIDALNVLMEEHFARIGETQVSIASSIRKELK
ncbi:MAG: hypothetical protein AAF720_13720 [Pseudomonadota bacterium]